MKLGKYFVVTAFALIFAVGVFAGEKNQGKLVLNQRVLVGTTQLQPGTYDVQWTGDASAVTVNIMRNHRVVATTQGQLKTSNVANQDAVVLTPSASDSSQMAVSEIDFGHGHEALLITPNVTNSSDQTQAQ